jgi:hypothetical protein
VLHRRFEVEHVLNLEAGVPGRLVIAAKSQITVEGICRASWWRSLDPCRSRTHRPCRSKNGPGLVAEGQSQTPLLRPW